MGSPGALLDGAAAHVEAPLKVVARFDLLRARQKRLDDGGHAGPRRLAEVVRVDGDLAPKEHGHARGGAAVLKEAPRVAHALRILGEKEHRHAVVALGGEKLALLLSLFAEEVVRDLKEDARAVAGVLLQAGAAAVLEVDEHRERVVEDLVAAHAVERGQGADAAGVMLELGAVEGARGVGG